eukprot:1043361-Rhodomonas_salina.1
MSPCPTPACVWIGAVTPNGPVTQKKLPLKMLRKKAVSSADRPYARRIDQMTPWLTEANALVVSIHTAKICLPRRRASCSCHCRRWSWHKVLLLRLPPSCSSSITPFSSIALVRWLFTIIEKSLYVVLQSAIGRWLVSNSAGCFLVMRVT